MSLFQKCLIQGGTSASQTTVLFCSTKQWTFPKGLRSIRTHQYSRLPPIPSSFFHSRVNQPHQGFCFIVYTLTWQLIDAPFFQKSYEVDPQLKTPTAGICDEEQLYLRTRGARPRRVTLIQVLTSAGILVTVRWLITVKPDQWCVYMYFNAGLSLV